ncbi:MAG: PQQ-dependent sugar dehydrogenase [Chloroflexota bacterium]
MGLYALSLILVVVLGACAAVDGPTEEITPTATDQPSATPTRTPTSPATAASAEPETGERDATSTPTAAPTGTATPEAAFEPVVGLELVAEGLNAPVELAPAGDGSGRLFVVDQVGVIRVLTAQGDLLEEPFLDIRDRMVGLRPGYDERGLLGLAFHPDYEENGLFYVTYSAPLDVAAPRGWDHTSHLSQFAVSEADENAADPGSEEVILRVHQPQSNHNGGKIAFGPDGYLYVGLGDGGGAHDVGTGHVDDWYEANEGGNAQNVTETLLGSIMRIDVNGANPYGIPWDNPFVGDEGLDEIWAYGLRNPYRFSFDSGGDQELFVADVGQNRWEEVNLVVGGGNYGWNVKEGSQCFSPAMPNDPPQECPDTDPDGNPLIDPIIEYENANLPEGLGRAVVGGYVYRGQALPGFEGRFVFGDWSTSFGLGDGTLFAATRPDIEGAMWSFEELRVATTGNERVGEFILALGQDAEGELYILTSETPGPLATTGKIYRVVPAE